MRGWAAGGPAKLERALVARLGTFAFAICLGLPAILSSSTARASVVVASIEGAPVIASIAGVDVEPNELIALQLPVESEIVAAEVSAAMVGPEPAPEPVAAPPMPPAAPPPVVAGVVAAPAPAWPPPEPLVLDGVVVASWYGPGFYGNTTACGQEYTPEILGVAHRTLPCGTPVRITSPAGKTLVVPVIDRGPFIAGRSLDLSNATRAALSCSDLCHVRMTVGQ